MNNEDDTSRVSETLALPSNAYGNEDLSSDVEETSDGTEFEDTGISKPFNPTLINILSKQMSLDTLIKRMREGEVDLSPDFQRAEVWKPTARSRLIESLLIRIPLPAFYMDATNEDKWLVVDGLQRLSTLRDFVIRNSLKLQDLEFLIQFHGFRYRDLPRNYQRRIEETQVTVYLIERELPPRSSSTSSSGSTRGDCRYRHKRFAMPSIRAQSHLTLNGWLVPTSSRNRRVVA
jgi:hypothetical protein